jgi:hypothetical protein
MDPLEKKHLAEEIRNTKNHENRENIKIFYSFLITIGNENKTKSVQQKFKRNPFKLLGF